MKTILAVLVILLLLSLGGWWFWFGSITPCGAMKLEAHRVARQAAGPFGAFADSIVNLQTDEWAPSDCAIMAVRLKFEGTKALKDLMLGNKGVHSSEE